MNIPEACIEAAQRFKPDEGGSGLRYTWTNKEVARRVILALAENMPQDAIDAAVKAYAKDPPRARAGNVLSLKKRAAIAAFLKHVAGDTPAQQVQQISKGDYPLTLEATREGPWGKIGAVVRGRLRFNEEQCRHFFDIALPNGEVKAGLAEYKFKVVENKRLQAELETPCSTEHTN